ncbi:MAG: penicillin acylase family protein, partial [Bacteroidia bacterium]|nr:penicillin acylase family protein [Bacteroidia bacterium]MDW8057816.1 penicillin acylase family protein [Bacteroidia bacterium]
SPFSSSCREASPKEESFPPQHAWHWNRHNNREHRLYELIEAKPRLSWEDFHAIKYDRQYPAQGPIRSIWSAIASLPDTSVPILQEALQIVRSWDFTGRGDSRAAALLILAGSYALKKAGLPAYNWLESGKIQLPKSLLWESLSYAVNQLRRFYNETAPPLEKVQALEVSRKRYSLDGMPEQLAPTYAEWDSKKGFLKVVAGDTYIQFVRFSRHLSFPEVESILPLGVSGDPSSPHYADQLPLYRERRCKLMTLDPLQVKSRSILVKRFSR